MAALPDSIPVPPFPRWTGVRARLAPARGDHLAVVLTIPRLTRRARLWLTWRALTSTGGPDAPAQR